MTATNIVDGLIDERRQIKQPRSLYDDSQQTDDIIGSTMNSDNVTTGSFRGLWGSASYDVCAQWNRCDEKGVQFDWPSVHLSALIHFVADNNFVTHGEWWEVVYSPFLLCSSQLMFTVSLC